MQKLLSAAMKVSASLAVVLVTCLATLAQTSSASVTARDLAGWYASHPIETGHVMVLDRLVTVRETPGVSKSTGEVMLSLYEVEIDGATFRLTIALGIEGGKPLDYFAVQNVTPETRAVTNRAAARQPR
jgi:hypothetical protein